MTAQTKHRTHNLHAWALVSLDEFPDPRRVDAHRKVSDWLFAGLI